eukprot:TRINITY_DN603_c0_g3_i1.p1 TRINITY_DN603_c0_g3~~TRINITY_DN603_c0_g3_i1.p1  ORF type:complete len:572 (+),score=179.92 TRINITY_DN603_c0_g3_i1:40-1716(+)
MSVLVLHVLLLATVDRSGDCVCDLTSVVCDMNCCCDPDCNENTVMYSFTRCEKEKYGARKGVRCTEPPVSLLEPHWINPRGGVDAVYNSDEEYYSRVIKTRASEAEKAEVCIVHDNLGLDDSSYNPQPVTRADLLSLNENRNLWNFIRGPNTNWVPPNGDGPNQLPGTWYRAGDVLNAQQSDGVLFPLPLPSDVNGVCNDHTPAYFLLDNIEGTTCTRTGSLETLCSWALSAAAWDIKLDGNQELTYTNGQPPTEWDSASSTCTNAVLQVNMVVGYQVTADGGSGSTKITSFKVALTLGSVTAADLPLNQKHTITWLGPDDDKTTQPTLYSGNPGYKRGTPINAMQGDVTTTFRLPMGYDCSSTEDDEVRFLFNVVGTGCSVELDLQEFGELCQAGVKDPEVLINTKVQGWPNPVRVATYGNSEPYATTPGDWTQIEADSLVPNDASKLATNRQCKFMVGYDYTFVLRRMGRVYNPQDFIGGVLKTPVYSTWTFSKRSPGAKQRFNLRWRASFIRKSDDNVKSDAIEAPPLLPVVSDDIFYPFHIDRNPPTPVEDSEL